MNGPKKNVEKKFQFFIICVQGGALIRMWTQHCERRLQSKFFKLGLDRINKPLQKSIFKAVFWVERGAWDLWASRGHQDYILVDHLRSQIVIPTMENNV